MSLKQTVIKHYHEHVPRKRSPYTMKRFMMLSQDGLSDLTAQLASRAIGMQAVRVLVAMMERADFRNRVEETHKDLASRLGMTQQNISKAAIALRDAGLIDQLGNRRGMYRISPVLAWKGDVETLEAELEKRAA